MQAAALRAEEILPDFMPQALANLLWGFAAVSHNPGKRPSALWASNTCMLVHAVEQHQRLPALGTFILCC